MSIESLQHFTSTDTTIVIYFFLVILDREDDLKKQEMLPMQHICKKNTPLISAMVSFTSINMFLQMKTWDLNKLGIWHTYLI